MAKEKLKFKGAAPRRQQFTELSNPQWEFIKELVDNGRKRKHCLRSIVNAILKVTRTGCQWRNLDEKYPPWQSVYYYRSGDPVQEMAKRWLASSDTSLIG